MGFVVELSSRMCTWRAGFVVMASSRDASWKQSRMPETIDWYRLPPSLQTRLIASCSIWGVIDSTGVRLSSPGRNLLQSVTILAYQREPLEGWAE